VVLRNVIVEFEVIEQRFGTGVLPHHDQQASASEITQYMEPMLPCTALYLLIRVTFSTPTPDNNSYSILAAIWAKLRSRLEVSTITRHMADSLERMS
jgi:hypothetical protein